MITSLYTIAINTSHLYGCYFFFVLLPGGLKRVIFIAVGTVYPLAASVVAVTTDETAEDDTQWLLYWCSFATLYLAMLLTEDILSYIPGYYALAVSAAVYLMLPMFRGADQIFRNLLVPLFRLQKQLALADVARIAANISKGVPKEEQVALRAQLTHVIAGHEHVE
uniref:Receptor expression-enhancing protein n=1 Tax=Haptolina brevifila TaxID=156173 RepID=A0A7S2GF49_9EUKA